MIEIVIAASIVSIAVFSLSSVFLVSSRLETQSSEKTRANFLAEEGIEAMRFLRDKGWSGNLAPLAVGTNYYLTFSTSTSRWSVGVSNPGIIDNTYTRITTVENVYRNGSDDIVASGGTLDPNSKKINIVVLWANHGVNLNVALSAYLFNIYKN